MIVPALCPKSGGQAPALRRKRTASVIPAQADRHRHSGESRNPSSLPSEFKPTTPLANLRTPERGTSPRATAEADCIRHSRARPAPYVIRGGSLSSLASESTAQAEKALVQWPIPLLGLQMQPILPKSNGFDFPKCIASTCHSPHNTDYGSPSIHLGERKEGDNQLDTVCGGSGSNSFASRAIDNRYGLYVTCR